MVLVSSGFYTERALPLGFLFDGFPAVLKVTGSAWDNQTRRWYDNMTTT